MPKKLLAARIREAARRIAESKGLDVSVADAQELIRQFKALPKKERAKVEKAVGGIGVEAGLNRMHNTMESMESLTASHPSKYDVLNWMPSSFMSDEAKPFLRGPGPKGREGKITLPSWDDLKKSNVGRTIRTARDEWYKLTGGQFPRMSRLSRAVADRAAALISAPAFANCVVGFLKRAVYGDMTKAEAAKFYTAHAEMRLEYMRRTGKPNAGTLIGPDSPLKTQAEYAATIRKPEFNAYLQRWKQHVVPIMNEHYWDAMGLPHGTPTCSRFKPSISDHIRVSASRTASRATLPAAEVIPSRRENVSASSRV